MLEHLIEDIQKIKVLQSVGVTGCSDLAKVSSEDLEFIESNVENLRDFGGDYARVVIEYPEHRDKLMSLDLGYRGRAMLCDNPDLLEFGEEYLKEYLSLVSGDTVTELKGFSIDFVKSFTGLFDSISDYDEATEMLALVETLKPAEIKAVETVGRFIGIKSCTDFKDFLAVCNATKLKHLTELLKNVPQNVRLPQEILTADNRSLGTIVKFVASLEEQDRVTYVSRFLPKPIEEQLGFITQCSELKKRDTSFKPTLLYELDFYNVLAGNAYADFVDACHKHELSKEVDAFLAFLIKTNDTLTLGHVIDNLTSISGLSYYNLMLKPEVFEEKIDFSSSSALSIILSDTINYTSTNYKYLEVKVTLDELRFLQEVSMNYSVLCNKMPAGPDRLKILQGVNALRALEGIQETEELTLIGAVLDKPLTELRAEWGLEYVNYNSLLKGVGKVGLDKMKQLTTKYLADVALANLNSFKEVNTIRELLIKLSIDSQSKVDDVVSFYKMPEYYKTRYKDNFDKLIENGSLDVLHSMTTWTLGKSRSRVRNDLAYSLVKDKFLEYKYNSLDRELATTLTDTQKQQWMFNYTFTVDDYVYEETDDLVTTLTYFDGNLNYKNGANKDLCFCLLDGCKKVWLVKKDNKVVLKAFVRLTKITLGNEPSYINKNTEQGDYLCIFIEHCDNLKLTKYETDVILGNIQNALLKKASDLQAQLISSLKLISRLSNSNVVQCSIFSGLTCIDKLYDVSSGKVLKPTSDGIYSIKHVNLITA